MSSAMRCRSSAEPNSTTMRPLRRPISTRTRVSEARFRSINAAG